MALNINLMLAEAKRIANDARYGYSIPNRMSGIDYDCSSFVAHCINYAGGSVNPYMDTTTENVDLLMAGFTDVGMSEPPMRGDIYFYDEGGGTSGHTFIVYDDQRIVNASGTKTSDHGSTAYGDQNQEYYGLDADGYDYHGEICFYRLPYDFSEHTWHHFRYNGEQPPEPPEIPLWMLALLGRNSSENDFNINIFI